VVRALRLVRLRLHRHRKLISFTTSEQPLGEEVTLVVRQWVEAEVSLGQASA
jgi:hypothetical protein